MALDQSSYIGAVYFGPTFGIHDLRVYGESNINRCSQMDFLIYEPPLGKTGVVGGNFVVGGSDNYFQTSEIEIFQVSNQPARQSFFIFSLIIFY